LSSARRCFPRCLEASAQRVAFQFSISVNEAGTGLDEVGECGGDFRVQILEGAGRLLLALGEVNRHLQTHKPNRRDGVNNNGSNAERNVWSHVACTAPQRTTLRAVLRCAIAHTFLLSEATVAPSLVVIVLSRPYRGHVAQSNHANANREHATSMQYSN